MEDANLISKTRRKKQMHDLQALGAALVKLPADQLRRIELPDDLREAVEACRPMTKHEAIRRQMQYIGKLMRHLEAGPIAAQLEALNAPAARETARFHRAERWRDALLADGDGLERFVQEFPEADAESLRRRAWWRLSIDPAATANSSRPSTRSCKPARRASREPRRRAHRPGGHERSRLGRRLS